MEEKIERVVVTNPSRGQRGRRINRLLTIGLTGGIGSGKSTVGRILARAGCLVNDSDEQVREVMGRPSMKKKLTRAFGRGILDAHGVVDRRRLAELVFGSAKARTVLEGIIHPVIERERKEKFDRAKRVRSGKKPRALVIDAPLLFEAGLDSECDAIIFVDAPRRVREERVRRGRGWLKGELGRREAAQMPLKQKRKMSDHVIVNGGGLAMLRSHVLSVLARILHEHRNVEEFKVEPLSSGKRRGSGTLSSVRRSGSTGQPRAGKKTVRHSAKHR